jgi:hypothetical protein
VTATPYRAEAPAPFTPQTAPTPILVDLFPAQVTLPAPPTPTPTDAPSTLSSTLYPARLIITADPDAPTAPSTVYVFTDSSAGPALLYSAPATARTGDNRQGETTTPEGPLSYQKAGGCGCGSALKSFAPFTHPYSVA